MGWIDDIKKSLEKWDWYCSKCGEDVEEGCLNETTRLGKPWYLCDDCWNDRAETNYLGG